MTNRRTRNQNPNPPDPTVSDQDRSLFRDAVGHTRPVIDDRVQHRQPKADARPRKPEAEERKMMAATDHPADQLLTVEAGEEIQFLRSGIQQRVLKKLRRGHFDNNAELDLHGMNVETARTNIDNFIHECQLRGIARLKIIHGKGLRSRPRGPVLKNLTNVTLQARSDVLAFVSARANDGGTGAVYVLLKTN